MTAPTKQVKKMENDIGYCENLPFHEDDPNIVISWQGIAGAVAGLIPGTAGVVASSLIDLLDQLTVSVQKKSVWPCLQHSRNLGRDSWLS